jgi:predicted RNA-binding Zn ribbon-like protein
MSWGPFDFSSDHPALDFINTRGGRQEGAADGLTSPGAVLDWLRQAGIVDEEVLAQLRVSLPEARLLLDEAVRLRRALLTLVTRFARGAPLSGVDLDPVNRVLESCPAATRIEAAEAGYRILATSRPRGPRGILAPLAAAAGDLLSQGEPSRVRQCAHPRCGLWFYDTSRNGSRRWCSMARCGNRAKVAAHHRRRRQGV